MCGFSSSGRAPPCQGGGSEFEPRKPLHFFASVAQLVEQGTENPRVIGSIPIGGTTASEQSSLCSDAFFAKKRHPPAPLLLLLPAKLCFANFRGGPGRPRGRPRAAYRLRRLFLQKVTGALTPLRLLFPAKLCFANFRGGLGRPRGRPRAAYRLRRLFCKKSPVRSFCCSSLPREILLRKFSRGLRLKSSQRAKGVVPFCPASSMMVSAAAKPHHRGET